MKTDRRWRIYRHRRADSHKHHKIASHSKWNRMALNYSLIFLVCSDRMIECFYVKNRALKTEGFGGIVKLCATLAKQFGGWSRLKALLLCYSTILALGIQPQSTVNVYLQNMYMKVHSSVFHTVKNLKQLKYSSNTGEK